MTSPEEILTAFRFRHATKTFDPNRKITDEDFQLILESAQLSPSSFGFEPWDILVVQDPTIRNEFLEAGTWGARGTLPTASHFIVMTAKTGVALQPHSEHILHVLRDIKQLPEANSNGTNKRYGEWQIDDFSLNSPELLHQWAARQAYIALGNMMTVAALRGIDSCPIEGFNIAKITDILEHRKLIDPNTDLPVVMLAFGYREKEQPTKVRRPLDEIV